ncbi:MAG: hypothetical protein KDA80_10340 [Planctomycetaceae bacterium]|nr:hypothetical protein [Planctomycetaceae bacterium]
MIPTLVVDSFFRRRNAVLRNGTNNNFAALTRLVFQVAADFAPDEIIRQYSRNKLFNAVIT